MLSRNTLNQLSVSVTGWQHESQICFATFICEKYKIANNSTITKAKERIVTDSESLEFHKHSGVCLTK